MTAERLYTVAEVADLWGTSKNYVYDRISSGELTSIDLGTSKAKTRVPESAVNSFLAPRTRGTKSRRAAA